MNENEWCAEFIYGAGADDYDDAIENMVVVEFMCGFCPYIVCGMCNVPKRIIIFYAFCLRYMELVCVGRV